MNKTSKGIEQIVINDMIQLVVNMAITEPTSKKRELKIEDKAESKFWVTESTSLVTRDMISPV